MGKKYHQKLGISLSLPVFLGNVAHGVVSVSCKITSWSVKLRYLWDNIMNFIDIRRINYTRS